MGLSPMWPCGLSYPVPRSRMPSNFNINVMNTASYIRVVALLGGNGILLAAQDCTQYLAQYRERALSLFLSDVVWNSDTNGRYFSLDGPWFHQDRDWQ
jgi:hypothetical protein